MRSPRHIRRRVREKENRAEEVEGSERTDRAARHPAGLLISQANCPDVPRNREEISVITPRTEAPARPDLRRISCLASFRTKAVQTGSFQNYRHFGNRVPKSAAIHGYTRRVDFFEPSRRFALRSHLDPLSLFRARAR